MPKPLILTGNLTEKALEGKVAIVTGAGQGIGYEAARSLVWLGANVVIAEINKKEGRNAAQKINQETAKDLAFFIKTDVSKERSINKLSRLVLSKFGKVDIVLNNATIAPLGAVKDSNIIDWDRSYRVNLRGPVLLARRFIPFMVKQDYGVFVCVSSEGLAYMGPYETMKSAQTHLAMTLEAELENTGVISFSIGPGFVATKTAVNSVEKLAKLYGKSEQELYEMYKEHVISVEAAGAAFAAAIVQAEHFRGQEIGARQALHFAGINPEDTEKKEYNFDQSRIKRVMGLCREVRQTLNGQYQGWKERPVFERQWILRDFKKNAGMTAEQWLDTLERLEDYLENENMLAIADLYLPLNRLVDFYSHLQELARGYVKDEEELKSNLKSIEGWKETTRKLQKYFQ